MSLFAREHNAICDRLRAAYPTWTGDAAVSTGAAHQRRRHGEDPHRRVDARAAGAPDDGARDPRNVVGAARRAREAAVRADRARASCSAGSPAPELDDEVPYSITEDFVAVYRHAPADPGWGRVPQRRATVQPMDGRRGARRWTFEELTATVRKPASRQGAAARRSATRTRGTRSGSPIPERSRCTTTRTSSRCGPAPTASASISAPPTSCARASAACRATTRFASASACRRPRRSSTWPTATQSTAAEIEAVYGDVDKVDLVVGLLADYKPKGFAISDTAFRVFLLMAARRLRSDPFFTDDYTAEVYTQLGLSWIDERHDGRDPGTALSRARARAAGRRKSVRTLADAEHRRRATDAGCVDEGLEALGGVLADRQSVSGSEDPGLACRRGASVTPKLRLRRG